MLHGFAGRSLLGHVLAAAEPLAATHTVGRGRAPARARSPSTWPRSRPTPSPVVQAEQNGTGHAVRIALESRAGRRPVAGTVLVLPGDAPLLHAEHAGRPAGRARASRRGRHPADQRRWTTRPATAGCIRDAPTARCARVVEHKDADRGRAGGRRGRHQRSTPSTPALLRDAVGRLTTDNAQGEEYLPDVVGILVAERPAGAAPGRRRPTETAGVNDRVQLAAAHRAYNDRLLEQHMRAGVTVVDPATTWVDADVRARAPTSRSGRTSTCTAPPAIAAGAEIGPQTHADRHRGRRRAACLQRTVAAQARIGADVTVGPFAYLRPGTELADGVHIGTYVEIKDSDVGVGSQGAAPDLRRRRHASASTPTSARPPSSSTTTACTSTAA